MQTSSTLKRTRDQRYPTHREINLVAGASRSQHKIFLENVSKAGIGLVFNDSVFHRNNFDSLELIIPLDNNQQIAITGNVVWVREERGLHQVRVGVSISKPSQDFLNFINHVVGTFGNYDSSYGVYKHSLLIPPIYAQQNLFSQKRQPSVSDIFKEWLGSINFLANHKRSLPCLSLCAHASNFIPLLFFISSAPSINMIIFFIGAIFYQATVYNTLWFHRYCSHYAYKFSRPAFRYAFLWTNPFFFREESYVIPHLIHHQRTEKAGDPYGPHLGWLGSYLATESQQKTNTNINEEQYDLLKRSLRHIGIHENSYIKFQQTGSVEKVRSFVGRSIFANIFYGVAIASVFGPGYLIPWHGGLFITFFLMRDFNWRGHGGNFRDTKKRGWEFDSNSRALNQHFYGYLASEWHDNHHKYPMSAKCGFLPAQPDIAFLVIRFLKRVGIVESYIDSTDRFRRDNLFEGGIG